MPIPPMNKFGARLEKLWKFEHWKTIAQQQAFPRGTAVSNVVSRNRGACWKSRGFLPSTILTLIYTWSHKYIIYECIYRNQNKPVDPALKRFKAINYRHESWAEYGDRENIENPSPEDSERTVTLGRNMDATRTYTRERNPWNISKNTNEGIWTENYVKWKRTKS